MTIKVVIVDDSAFIRKKIAEILTEHPLIQIVDRAKNGIEAIEMVKKHRPDVLVLDLIMPKMDGLEAFKRIIAEYPTPTIILSAVNPRSIQSNIQALLIGAFDYIVKPGGLGAKDLPRFKEELLSKVLLASESQIRRIVEKELTLQDKKSMRQSIVDEAFEFGEKLSKAKPIQEIEDIEKIESQEKIKRSDLTVNLRQSIVDEVFQAGKVESLYPLKNRIEEKALVEVEKIKPKVEESAKIRPVKHKIEIPQKLEKIIIEEKEEVDLIKPKEVVESISEGIKKEKLKPQITQISEPKTKLIKREISETAVISSKMRLERPKSIVSKASYQLEKFDKKVKKLIIPDLKPVKGVVLKTKVIVIGASVGGPRTLTTILNGIPKNFKCPILIVQHLGSQFIETFTKTLDDATPLDVKVGKNSELLQPGNVYVAPGDQHMEISVKNGQPCVKTYVGTPVNYCMPSIDILFFSAARVYKYKTLGILLTGMGEDGAAGLGAIQKIKGKTIAESKETSILYGMPKIAAETGFANLVLPNYKIKDFIISFVV